MKMSSEELNEILEKHKMWLRDEEDGVKAYLHGSDLSNADLSNADLTEAVLRGADIRGADLRCAVLRGADLKGANLSNADLTEAVLRCAIIRGANLSGADLSGADLKGSDLSGAYLRGANLDYSCLPLWCGSFDIKVDENIAYQIAYHLCRMKCDNEDVKKMQELIKPFANKFNRVLDNSLDTIK